MRRVWVLLLLAALAGTAGCSGRDNGSDADRQGGFYGGVLGGLTR